MLRELEIEAQAEALPPQQPRGFDSLEDALEQLSRRLYLKPNSSKKSRLEHMLPDVLEEVDGRFQIRSAGLIRTELIWWQPVDGPSRGWYG